jgi:hypothetical protein
MIKILFALSTFAILFTSCETIIAEDISAITPVLILPASADTVEFNPIHFKWQEIEGATNYHLQVVSPSFSLISEYLLDTVVTGSDFFFDLDSNEYELMLTANNGAYTTQTLGPVKFWVGATTTTSTSNVVVLSYPSDGLYVNEDFTNEFEWEDLSNETNFEFQIREGTSFATGTLIDLLPNLSSTSVTLGPILTEGEYIWGVKAYFTSSETLYSLNTLYVDTVNPNKAVLSLPVDASTELNGTIAFTWNNGTDGGAITSPMYSRLQIATDAGFTDIIEDVEFIGSTHNFDFTPPLLGPGTYHWRVLNNDDAGNDAPDSDIFTVTIQ